MFSITVLNRSLFLTGGKFRGLISLTNQYNMSRTYLKINYTAWFNGYEVQLGVTHDTLLLLDDVLDLDGFLPLHVVPSRGRVG